MHDIGRRRLLGGMLIASGAAAVTGLAATNVRAELAVAIAPPPPHTEAVPAPPAQRVEIELWQSGYWHWNGREHVWIEGQYVARPQPRAEWIAGRWEQRPRGWAYVEGHWN